MCWLELPRQPAEKRHGEWVDATYPVSPDVPRVQSFPPPSITRVSEMPHKPLNVTRIDTIVHMGTHLDAPRHFFLDGPAMESIPLQRLMGRGVSEVQRELKYFPFRLADNVEEGEVPRVQLGELSFTPPEISAYVLRQLKRNAERFLLYFIKWNAVLN